MWTRRQLLCGLAVATSGAAVLGGGCRATSTFSIFAAASLQEVTHALAERYFGASRHFTVNIGGSSLLATQLRYGAAADVFLSADLESITRGLGDRRCSPPVAFAHNRLVLIAPADNPAHLRSVDDLARSGVRLVLAGSAVPAGRYGRAALRSRNVLQRLDEESIATEDSVRGVLGRVLLGEADAGIVYATDVRLHPELWTLPLPVSPESTPTYWATRLDDSRHLDRADAFIAFIRGPEGQKILQDAGFEEVTR